MRATPVEIPMNDHARRDPATAFARSAAVPPCPSPSLGPAQTRSSAGQPAPTSSPGGGRDSPQAVLALDDGTRGLRAEAVRLVVDDERTRPVPAQEVEAAVEEDAVGLEGERGGG